MPPARCIARAAAACLGALLAAAPGLAQPAPELRITEYGEYVVGHAARMPGSASGVAGVSEMVAVDGVRFVERTSRIEAEPCRRFGIAFEAPSLGPDSAVRVTIRLTHPLLVRPDGRRGEQETWPLLLTRAPGMAGYAFDNAWERAPGRWTFAVLLDDRVLAEHAFEVVEAPGVSPAGGCGVPVS